MPLFAQWVKNASVVSNTNQSGSNKVILHPAERVCRVKDEGGICDDESTGMSIVALQSYTYPLDFSSVFC